jgi:ABC-type bacteriocin/lantibiotic exporter with double-glycine peptidase domain
LFNKSALAYSKLYLIPATFNLQNANFVKLSRVQKYIFMLTVGIAGRTGSGKTTIKKHLSNTKS